jgi:Na+/H+ antiporter NhaD/arsenite permease-like protein
MTLFLSFVCPLQFLNLPETQTDPFLPTIPTYPLRRTFPLLRQAYISLSLDQTGLLRYLASKVALQASKSPPLLWSAFYLFFTLTGLLVGNDPLILSGTPFLAYFTAQTKITDPTAYLFSHFQVANLVSAFLVSSNPTNLVLTSAFGLSFLQYSAWLALPTVAGVVVLFPVLRWGVLRGRIPRKLDPPDEKAKEEMGYLKDKWGGIFGAGLFVVTIVLLVGLSAGGKLEGVEGVWTVTAPAALLMVARDVGYDLRHKDQGVGKEGDGKGETDMEKQSSRSRADAKEGVVSRGGRVESAFVEEDQRPSTTKAIRPEHHAGGSSNTTSEELQESASHEKESEGTNPSNKDEAPSAIPLLRPFQTRLPTTYTVISHLPLALLPFAFSMFILVESLQHTGWIRVFGGWWAAWAKVGGVAGCIWLMGMISVLGCNVSILRTSSFERANVVHS